MGKCLFAIMCVLMLATPVFAVYDDSTVVSVLPGNQDMLFINVDFTGLDEPTVQRTYHTSVLYTDEALKLWAEQQLLALNALKSITAGARAKTGDKPLVSK